jgi:hypothetical protein
LMSLILSVFRVLGVTYIQGDARSIYPSSLPRFQSGKDHQLVQK